MGAEGGGRRKGGPWRDAAGAYSGRRRRGFRGEGAAPGGQRVAGAERRWRRRRHGDGGGTRAAERPPPGPAYIGASHRRRGRFIASRAAGAVGSPARPAPVRGTVAQRVARSRSRGRRWVAAAGGAPPAAAAGPARGDIHGRGQDIPAAPTGTATSATCTGAAAGRRRREPARRRPPWPSPPTATIAPGAGAATPGVAASQAGAAGPWRSAAPFQFCASAGARRSTLSRAAGTRRRPPRRGGGLAVLGPPPPRPPRRQPVQPARTREVRVRDDRERRTGGWVWPNGMGWCGQLGYAPSDGRLGE